MDNRMLSQNGLLVADNGKKNFFYAQKEKGPTDFISILIVVLFRGQVVNEERSSSHVESLKKFNDHIMSDNRVQNMLLPVFDGLMLVWHGKKI